jgi:protein-L-isoaspartate(D-aspartate) O-methyltransferase
MSENDPDKDVNEFLARSRSGLILSLKAEGILKSKSVEQALQDIPREEFLWTGSPKSLAYLDEPVSLNQTGQTISAPHMVVMMLEELELKPGLKVLEVGAGSGYNAALITCMVTKGISEPEDPLVVTIERNPLLANFARENIERMKLSGYCRVVEGDGSLGYPQEAEWEFYDRIIVTAGAPRVPAYLKKQLKVGGIMEVPVGSGMYQRLLILKKNAIKEFEQRRSVDCVFVPLIGADAHNV